MYSWSQLLPRISKNSLKGTATIKSTGQMNIGNIKSLEGTFFIAYKKNHFQLTPSFKFMHTVQGFAILTTTFYSSSLSTPSKKLFLRLMGYNKALDKGKKKHKKGLWSPDEDQRLRNYVLKHGHGCWTNVSINAGEYIPNDIWASRESKFHAIYFESQSLVWFDLILHITDSCWDINVQVNRLFH